MQSREMDVRAAMKHRAIRAGFIARNADMGMVVGVRRRGIGGVRNHMAFVAVIMIMRRGPGMGIEPARDGQHKHSHHMNRAAPE